MVFLLVLSLLLHETLEILGASFYLIPQCVLCLRSLLKDRTFTFKHFFSTFCFENLRVDGKVERTAYLLFRSNLVSVIRCRVTSRHRCDGSHLPFLEALWVDPAVTVLYMMLAGGTGMAGTSKMALIYGWEFRAVGRVPRSLRVAVWASSQRDGWGPRRNRPRNRRNHKDIL